MNAQGRMWLTARVLAGVFLLLSAAGASAQATAAARGGQLYEQSCTSCHGKSVHDRNPRSARNLEEVRHFVERWSNEVGAHWSAQQLDNVVLYLNQRYYHYPCGQPDCRRERVSGDAPRGRGEGG